MVQLPAHVLQLSVLCVDDSSLEEVHFRGFVGKLADLHLLFEEASACVVDGFVPRLCTFLVCSGVLEYDVPHGLVHLLVHVLSDVGPDAFPSLLSPSFAIPVFARFAVRLTASVGALDSNFGRAFQGIVSID